MPESSMWSLIVTLICSLIIISFNMALRLAELKRSLQLRDEEFERFFSEIETLQKNAKDAVLRIQEKHDLTLKVVTESYAKEIEKLKKNMEQIENPPKVAYTPFLLVKRPKQQ